MTLNVFCAKEGDVPFSLNGYVLWIPAPTPGEEWHEYAERVAPASLYNTPLVELARLICTKASEIWNKANNKT